MDTVAVTRGTDKSNTWNVLKNSHRMIIPKLDLGKCLGTQHLFLVFTEFVFIYAENSPSFQVYLVSFAKCYTHTLGFMGVMHLPTPNP